MRYLEDFEAGQKFGSSTLRVEAEGIKRFAAEFDPQPFHLDEASAHASLFRGLAASGWHTAAITMSCWSTAISNQPAASSAPGLTNSAGHDRSGQGTSFGSKAKCSRYEHRSLGPTRESSR